MKIKVYNIKLEKLLSTLNIISLNNRRKENFGHTMKLLTNPDCKSEVNQQAKI